MRLAACVVHVVRTAPLLGGAPEGKGLEVRPGSQDSAGAPRGAENPGFPELGRGRGLEGRPTWRGAIRRASRGGPGQGRAARNASGHPDGPASGCSSCLPALGVVGGGSGGSHWPGGGALGRQGRGVLRSHSAGAVPALKIRARRERPRRGRLTRPGRHTGALRAWDGGGGGRGDPGGRTPRSVVFQESAPSAQPARDARPADLRGPRAQGSRRGAGRDLGRPRTLPEGVSAARAPTGQRRPVLQSLRVVG